MSIKIPAFRQAQLEIKNYIKKNQLGLGDSLPSEALLSKELGISRPSLREAIKSLESLGVVESRHGEGLYVKHFSFDSIIENLPYSIDEGDQNIKNLLHTRKYLELGALPTVIRIIDDESIAKLRILGERMLSKARSNQTFEAEDSEFHAEIFRCLNNKFLSDMIDLFWRVFNNMNHSSDTADHWSLELTAKDHLKIVDMLEEKDIFGLLAAHMQHFETIVSRYPEE